jgi:hypothetical protein
MKALGLLGDFAPNAIPGLLGAMMQPADTLKTSAAFNDFLAMGGNPNDMESFAAFKQSLSGSNAEAEANLALLTARMQEMIRETEQESRTQSELDQNINFGVVSGLNSLRKMADANKKLNSSLLQTGLPAPELRRIFAGGVQAVKEFFGADTTESRQLLAAYDDFIKVANDFAIESMARLQGTGSAFRLQTVLDANANASASPETNNMIIIGNLEELLNRASIRRGLGLFSDRNMSAEDEAEIRKLIEELRQFNFAGEPNTVRDLSELPSGN